MVQSSRYTVLAAATVASLSCGLNYCFSAYAPQLGNRLQLTSTQLNTVGAAGNLGVYLSSPIIGRIVDRNGPKPMLVFAAIALTSGYLIIRAFYTTASGDAFTEGGGGWFAVAGVPGLVAAQLLTGMGSTAGLSSVGNSVAKSFRKRRAAALSVVLSGFGLSAFFYSTISSLFLHPSSHPTKPRATSPESILAHATVSKSDTTSSFLLLLALGSLFSMLVGLVFVKPVPPASKEVNVPVQEDEGEGQIARVPVDTATQGEEDGNDEFGESESGLTVRAHRGAYPALSDDANTSQQTLLPSPSPSSPRRTAYDLNSERTPLLRRGNSTSSVVPERNITGWALLREVDFYLIFMFNGLCAGVGLCYINNLGTIVRSLSYPLEIPPDQIALDQSRLVSLLSVFNFLGRLMSGFGSDWLLHRHRRGRGREEEGRMANGVDGKPTTTTIGRGEEGGSGGRRSIPRVAFLPLTSLLFLLSQLSLLFISISLSSSSPPTTSSPARALSLPTALIGLAHGSLFGLSGIIGLERFGMRSFSQTNGVLALAPALFGQTTNLIFGRIYDSHLPSSHSPSPSPSSLVSSPSSSPAVAAGAGAPTCTSGAACYIPAVFLTCGMSVLATGVGVWLAVGRGEMRRRAG
ncbi:hypothetical protein JCM10908_002252 [Rhodotorula pacifica]|uniref:uncharacterized protein n=1 Tax=Rhodotorula pacifica TaxID=1495444 RepID=UPI0031741B7C